MKKAVLYLVSAFFMISSQAQFTRYIIRLKDKGSSSFTLSNPNAYLSQRAIDRRTRYSIPIDSTDLPVSPAYIDSIRSAGAVTILNISKWLNSITIKTNDAAALAKINSLPFVINSGPIAARTISGVNKYQSERIEQKPSSQKLEGSESYYNYGLSLAQIHIHNGEFLHDIGLRGQGMVIGMLDAGFYNYTSLHAFDSVNLNGQVLGIYDFVAHDSSVIEDDQHGMECFSTMAANIPGTFVGTAPKASFYLFRTEDASSEYPIEEHNWVCGAERIDSAGGDVISSSLGYNQFDSSRFNHTYADMNGHTTMAAIGADMAARKGILVVNAAGNEGTNAWHYIVTPADGDSVMAVGAVTTAGVAATFSSYGPSSDGQVKPNVASVGQGTVVEGAGNAPVTGNGTSFACPNMAGLTTCLWEGFPEFNNMKIIYALQQAGSKATAPDDQVGYGIPDVKKAVMNLLKDYAKSTASIANCISTISWQSKDVHTMKYEIERELPGESSYSKIGALSGSGITFSNQSYQFKDTLTNAQAGVANYRIRQIIDTSSSGFLADYIDTATLSISASCVVTSITSLAPDNNDISVTPNPTYGNFLLNINTPDYINDLKITLIDMTGQVVKTINTSKSSGKVSIPVNISNLARTKYFISVYRKGVLLGTSQLIRL